MLKAKLSQQILKINISRNYARRMSTTEAPSSFSESKLDKDKRYQHPNPGPQSILDAMHKETVHSPGFSIKGDAILGRPAYLDLQATTPCDPRVVDAMLPYMIGRYGNPHSKTHSYGWQTESAVEQARENVAKLIGATSKEIIFVSGATEANNMVIKGK